MENVPATTNEWRALAKIDPLYVVAAVPGKRGAWRPADFYSQGASDWADCERRWRQYEAVLGGVCVEVGCGAGRLTHALCGRFDKVIGLDVSEDMIRLARSACPPNAEFMQVDNCQIPLDDGAADAVFTCHVLQHLDGPDYVRRYLAEMRRVLRPGGTAMVHTALRSERRPVWRRIGNDVRLAITRRMLAHGREVIAWRGLYYQSEQLRSWLDAAGFTDIELREFPMQSNHDPHPFWLVRRSAEHQDPAVG